MNIFFSHQRITKLDSTRKNNEYIQKILKCELITQIFLLGIIPENIDVKCQFANLHTDSYKDKFGPMWENKNPANDAMNRPKLESMQ